MSSQPSYAAVISLPFRRFVAEITELAGKAVPEFNREKATVKRKKPQKSIKIVKNLKINLTVFYVLRVL